MNPAPLIINIPQPCTQSWDEMVPDGTGRHCSSCKKTVTDFTSWSDGEIYKFFAKNTGEICGRFSNTQVNRPIAVPYQPHSKLYRLFIAAGLVLMFTSAQEARGQSVVTSAYHQVDSAKSAQPKKLGNINGVVLDDKNQPIINAYVRVLSNDSLKGSALSDSNGQYIINNLDTGLYAVIGASVGYNNLSIVNVSVSNNQVSMVNIYMTAAPILGGIAVGVPYGHNHHIKKHRKKKGHKSVD